MKTSDEINVIEINNGKYICKHCGRKLNVIKCEDHDRYERWSWNEYECSCPEWDRYYEIEKELIKVNKEFYELYREYTLKYNTIRKETRSNFKKVKMYDLKEIYV